MARITTVHPRTYNEARVIGEHFRDGTPVIMNLTEMDHADAKRLVDFAAGLIFWEIRIPRAVLGALVGAALGLSGAALQGYLRNPLAEPSLVGVSGGAAVNGRFTAWSNAEPNNASGDLDCVATYPDDHWAAQVCEMPSQFACSAD